MRMLEQFERIMENDKLKDVKHISTFYAESVGDCICLRRLSKIIYGTDKTFIPASPFSTQNPAERAFVLEHTESGKNLDF